MATSKRYSTPASSKRKQRDAIHVKVDKVSESLSVVNQTLGDLQKRVNDSPVMNGGFSKLMYTIDSMGKKVDSIHDAVFDPDEGLFARIKVSENTCTEKINLAKQDIVVLQSWRLDADKRKKDADDSTARVLAITKELEKQIVDINRWKTTTISILKWIGATLGTGTAGLIGKLVYETVTKHM